MDAMFSEALHDISRPSCLAIIAELKRSGGLAIPELAKLLDMSYMGIKQHCIRLESKDTESMARAQSRGRASTEAL